MNTGVPPAGFSPLAFILIPAGYLFAWPLTDWLLQYQREDRTPLQVMLTALSLGSGLLTLALFWAGLLPGRWLTAPVALGVVLAGLGAGLAVNWRWVAPRQWRGWWLAQWQSLKRLDFESLLKWSLIGVGTIMLVHGLYYPFIGDDTLSRYGLQAQIIYEARRLPESISGYPPLVPLSFVATWFAAENTNEHLARLFPVVMAFATLGAAYLVGQHIGGRRVGLLAAVILALTPFFIRNGTLEYTDIPTAFPLTLALLYVLRWWDTGDGRDALLGGILAGVALFTKQSALTWLASLAVVPALRLLATRKQPHVRRWQQALIGWVGLLLPPLVIAGPWYVRNWMLDGPQNIVPIAGLYHVLAARMDWRGIFPSLGWANDFGLALAPVYALGWGSGLYFAVRQGWQVLKGQSEQIPADLILSAMAIPYWLAWWTRFAFDARFLLLILPIMAVWSARPMLWAIERAADRVHLPRLLWQIGGSALLLGLIVWGAHDRLGGLYRTLTRPFASETERLLEVQGRLYRQVLYVRTHIDPVASRLAVMDGRLLYYLRDYAVDVMYPLRLADLQGYDYLIHSSSIYGVYGSELGWQDSEFYQHAFDPLIFEPVFEIEGVHIMRILRTNVPTPQEYEAYRQAHPETMP
jgi:hypothetical protein